MALSGRVVLRALIASLICSGCTYHVIKHDRPAGSLVHVSLRRPLVASVTAEDGVSPDAIVKLCQLSGYFSTVGTTPSASDDVQILFGGTKCNYFPDDGPLRIVVGMISLPTLFLIPMHSASWLCTVELSYHLKSSPDQEYSTPYAYSEDAYTAGLGKALFGSEARQRYQSEFLIDQAVTELLNQVITRLKHQNWTGQ